LVTISPRAAPLTFQVRYAPIDLGADTGTVLLVTTEAGQGQTYLVRLRASGAATSQQTDTFSRGAQPKADVLLVVDDSGSMATKQASLGNAFASVIQHAANVEYHLGVTTTSVDAQAGGELRRDTLLGIRYLTPATPGVATAFARMVNVGIAGSPYERALEASVRALTPPKTEAENAGFLRDDASLAVVVVSDASDQSPEPVTYYQNRLLNVKGFTRRSMFTFSVIGPWLATAPTGCTYDADHDPARYQPIVGLTAGYSGEICSSNWTSMMEEVGKVALGFRTQFFLSQVPDLTRGQTVEVLVNGVRACAGTNCSVPQDCLVPPGVACFDPSSNSVKFNPARVPTVGEVVTAVYDTTCY
jgi:hypothetical protein